MLGLESWIALEPREIVVHVLDEVSGCGGDADGGEDGFFLTDGTFPRRPEAGIATLEADLDSF